jgi:ribosomal protein S18 acetylase RimI-like enzyme
MRRGRRHLAQRELMTRRFEVERLADVRLEVFYLQPVSPFAPLRHIDSAAGPLALRAETDADAVFLFRLFAASREGPFRAMGLPPAQIVQLLEFQHRSQSLSYRHQHPGAAFLIVEAGGEPIGRLVENPGADAAEIVDVAVVPAWLRRGVARALLSDVLSRAADAGRGARAHIAWDNTASQALFSGLGFALRPTRDPVYLEAVWPSV